MVYPVTTCETLRGWGEPMAKSVQQETREAADGVVQEVLPRDLPDIRLPTHQRTALSPKVLGAAKVRLGVEIPAALRDFYLVAGRERRFSASLHRVLPPSEWFLDKQRLIFMEENQTVLWWGVSTRNPDSDDPPVSQRINDGPIAWVPEHRRCSVFLAVTLHYNAVSGGFRFCGSGDAPEQSAYRFKDHGWTCYGEVNSLLAYSRPNQAVCLIPPGNLPFMQRWSVLAGGKTKGDLRAIADELGVAVT